MSNDLHMKAFLTHFELACEFSVLICVTDMMWLLHDIGQNGMSISYFFVASGLSAGLVGTIWVLFKHHYSYTHRLFKNKGSKRTAVKGVSVTKGVNQND